MSAPALFRAVLGANFDKLAPVLQKHYDLAPLQVAVLRGEMIGWNRYQWLRPLMPFAPRNGAAHVEVHNRSFGDAGQICFEWRRTFRYRDGAKTHHTHTITRPARNPYEACVLDTFVQTPMIGITLQLAVQDDGHTLTQTAFGPQFLIAGQRYIRLPRLFNIRATATEQALNETQVQSHITISHALFGPLFGYSGALQLTITSV
jgi:hypothetical protein